MTLRHGNTAARDCSAGPSEWRVTDRNCNHSAFNGYRYTPSAYSRVKCTACGWSWRSRGKFVRDLKDATAEERRL